MTYLLLKYVHVIGAAVLLGTGAGIAFFMLLAHRTGEAAIIAAVARIVVIADFVFTATAIVTGLFWLPVVWMQARMRDLARQASDHGKALPAEYHRLFRLWFAFGFPAFAAVLAIYWLMIAKPVLW
jgi:uncharacterized membrane protein